MLLDHLPRESKVFDLEMRVKQRFSAKFLYQSNQGSSRNVFATLEVFPLGRSMFSCAKLCDTSLKQFQQLLYSGNSAYFTDVGMLLKYGLVTKAGPYALFCDLSSDLVI